MMHEDYTPIEVYRMMVRDCLSSEVAKTVENSTVEHAVVVVSEMILAAQKSILAYLSEINRVLWTDVRVFEAMKYAIGAGVRVQLLISGEQTDSDLISRFRSIGVDLAYSSTLPKEMNFLVVDEKHIRIETDMALSAGVAALNAPKYAQQLSVSFEMVKAKLVAARTTTEGAR